MGKTFVVYNGIRMIEGWPERIEQAQSQTTVVIEGRQYNRVRYGEERDDWNAEAQPCHDCRVVKGQFHVQGCDVESCPACGEQAIGCDCNYDDEDDD